MGVDRRKLLGESKKEGDLTVRHKMIGILSLLFSSLLFAVPASAFVLDNCAVEGQNEFVLVGQDNIIFEGGDASAGKVIQGSVLVTDPTNGFVKLGKNIHVTGAVIAHRIDLHSSGTVRIDTQCVADVFTSGAGPASAALISKSCPGGVSTFAAYAAAHASCVNPPLGTLAGLSICGATPVVDTCVNGKPPVLVTAGSTLDLAAGCYGALNIKNGAVVNLGAGTFTFPSVHMNPGSKLLGPPDPSPNATVNVNGEFSTDSGVSISNINLNIAFNTSAEVLKIFNNSTLTDVVVNAPLGKCHLHTGTDLAACSEVCCQVQDVEPIKAECIVERDKVCACPAGFKFELPPDPAVLDQSPVSELARNCVPCQEGDTFPSCLIK